MAQGDVLDFLSRNPDEWFVCKNIALELGISKSACLHNLNALIKQGFVFFRIRTGHCCRYREYSLSQEK